jgi:cytochrome bd-type quinol oxidase subunit 2
MFFPVDDTTRRKARTPHELAMVNLIVFNLLIGVALLAGSMAEPDSMIGRYKWLAVSTPLALSLVLIGVTWIKSRRPRKDASWFASTHWRLAASRYRLILIAYLVCAAILSIALLGKTDETEIAAQLKTLPPAMQEMERHKIESQDMASAIWARIGVVPLLLAVMVTIMLESGALYQAGRGELPDTLVARFPPPDGLVGSETEPPVA